MSSRNDAPNWADQWGTTGSTYDDDDEKKPSNKAKGEGEQSKKMGGDVGAKMKVGIGKAKTAATVGAQKVKTGTSLGIKWLKAQYEKKTGPK